MISRSRFSVFSAARCLWLAALLAVVFGAAASAAPDKLAPVLQRALGLGAAPKAASAAPAAVAPASLIRKSASGRWLVYVYFTPGETTAEELKAALRQTGAAGVQSALGLNVVQAWAQPGQLEALAGLRGVRFVGIPAPGHTRTGEVLSEGDAVLRADVARAATRVDGTGVRVGVISDGVVNREFAQLTGDLPPVLYIRPAVEETDFVSTDVIELVTRTLIVTTGTQPNLTTDTVTTFFLINVARDTTVTTLLEGGEGTGDEGTAMAEIIHDLAPGAELGFAPATMSDLEFINSIADLANNFGAQVIVDDIGYFTEPMYETGPIARAARQAVAQGVSYFTAAGNDADQHYEARLNTIAGPNALPGLQGEVHNFGNGKKLLDVGEFSSGDTIVVWLQWNDPFDFPVSNYKLHLFLTNDVNAGPVASSENFGGLFFPTEKAGEVLGVQLGAGASRRLSLAVERTRGPANQFTLLNLPSSHELANVAGADSIYGQSGVPEVNTVGAVFWGTPNDVEFFSSRGPSTIFFPEKWERPKPNFVATDGVSVTGAGGFPSPFFGTSAAAPHAAAVGALVLSQTPGLAPVELQELLQRTAIPIGGQTGFSPLSGFGRVDAATALGAQAPGARAAWGLLD